MRKADIVLVVLAVVALVLTGVAVAKSDAWTGERAYTYSQASPPLPAQGPTGAGSVPARFEWTAPDNATGTSLVVTIDYSGQAVQGGAAAVRISGTAPDGTQLPVLTRSLPIGQGATSASLEVPYNATWAMQPSKVRDTQSPDAWHWDRPLVVLVTVEPPSDVPAASYAFTAGATGSFTVFSAT